ncbi:MAG: endonuclease domain-containing protein [Bacteroidales bacterium]
MPNPPSKPTMHLDARHLLKRAKRMRREPTPAEEALWQILRNRNVHGLKFRRQHPILFYIADFYCHELRLIVEVDGGIHSTPAQMKKDWERTANLEANGIRVVRFTNEQVLERMSEVVEVLKKMRVEGL